MLTIRKRRIAAIAASAAAALLIAAPLALAGGNAMKLEGAWVSKVQLPGSKAQWSLVFSPAPSGRSAALHGSIDVSIGTPVPVDRTTPLLGEVVMTGPTTAKFNSVWYGIANSAVVYIGVNVGTIEFTAPDKSTATNHLMFFWPEADADGDGFPDPGTTPFFAAPAPVPTNNTRLPIPQ